MSSQLQQPQLELTEESVHRLFVAHAHDKPVTVSEGTADIRGLAGVGRQKRRDGPLLALLGFGGLNAHLFGQAVQSSPHGRVPGRSWRPAQPGHAHLASFLRVPTQKMASQSRVGPTPGRAAPQSEADQLLREALRYQTVERAASWPLVTNTTADLLTYYHSTKKRSDSLRMLLTFSEVLLSMYCRLLVLPIARSPFARTPLKIADHFTSKGARLLEAAVPRLVEKHQPLAVDGELLATLVFLPLSLCLAAAHGVLEGVADRFVSVFPPLREAARDFDKKGLVGQWVTLLLMTYVYLPLQFVSHPSETIQQIFSIPSRITWAVINWNIGNLMAVLNEVAGWVEWARDTAAYCFYTWLGLVIIAVEYWYYAVFKVTGLERSLMSLVRSLRDYIENGDGAIAKLLSSLSQSPMAQWLADQLANSEVGLVLLLKSLWNGLDEREDLKQPRRAGGRGVRLALPEGAVAGPVARDQLLRRDLSPQRAAAVAGPSASH
ncbi:uncharacterized protein LOC119101779 [Pollicipes pollicipes]|uniref:uncharacterized protein LOC119101779 n=2 Tax=Pollicipes pollicipes TaxID=41117 RepID=UPI0018850CDB|nr:uncharacterized protein LOC119101779 [Pollicipes pollicipes]